MTNRIITADEAARDVAEITKRYAEKLPEKDREAFVHACYEWLAGLLMNSPSPRGDST